LLPEAGHVDPPVALLKHLRIVGQGTPGVKRWWMALADDIRQRFDDLWAKALAANGRE
jgi:hypothetical protein